MKSTRASLPIRAFNPRRALGALGALVWLGVIALPTIGSGAAQEARPPSAPRGTQGTPTFRQCVAMMRDSKVKYSAKITDDGFIDNPPKHVYFGEFKATEKLPGMVRCPGERLTVTYGAISGEGRQRLFHSEGNRKSKTKKKRHVIFTDVCNAKGRFTAKVIEDMVYIDQATNQRQAVHKHYRKRRYTDVKCPS